MAENVIHHAKAVKALLAKIPRRSKSFRKTAEDQKWTLEQLLDSVSLTVDQSTALNDAISEINFPDDLSDELRETIRQATAAGGVEEMLTKHGALKGQDFTAFVEYLTNKQWDYFEDKSIGLREKGVSLMNVLKGLGMVTGTCPTFGVMVAFLLLLHYGDAHALAIQPKAKWNSMKGLKKLLSKKNLKRPDVYVKKLPSSPAVYKEKFPTLYKVNYSPTDPPVPFRLCLGQLSEIIETVPLRSNSNLLK